MSQLTIEYCVQWNYEPRAAGLAASIERQLGLQAKLIKGKGGAFEVVLDGQPVFSKRETGRFPDPEEVEEALRSLVDTTDC